MENSLIDIGVNGGTGDAENSHHLGGGEIGGCFGHLSGLRRLSWVGWLNEPTEAHHIARIASRIRSVCVRPVARTTCSNNSAVSSAI